MVWYDGLADWTRADKIEELKFLFASILPPIKKPAVKKSKKREPVRKPRSKAPLVFLGVVIMVVMFAALTNPHVDVHKGMVAEALKVYNLSQ